MAMTMKDVERASKRIADGRSMIEVRRSGLVVGWIEVEEAFETVGGAKVFVVAPSKGWKGRKWRLSVDMAGRVEYLIPEETHGERMALQDAREDNA